MTKDNEFEIVIGEEAYEDLLKSIEAPPRKDIERLKKLMQGKSILDD